MKNKKTINRFILCIIVALTLAVLGELLYNLPVLMGRKENLYDFKVDELTYEGFQKEEDKLLQTEESAVISIPFEEQYVDKFSFNYSGNTAQAMNCRIVVHTKNTEGKAAQKIIEEKNNITVPFSVVNIRTKTDQIDLCFDEMQNLTVTGIQMNNTGNISFVRIGYIFVIVFFICFLLINKHELFNKVENIFLGMVLMIGTLLIISMPPHKISWDEEIHFRNAYGLSYLMEGKSEMFYPPSVELLSVASLQNWPYDLPNSEEEYKAEYQFWNLNGSHELKGNEELYTGRIGVSLNLTGYVSQALLIEIGKILHLPFTVIFLMGRFGNLLLYSAICYLAIRHMTIGKRIMAVVALMPTPMFIASTYSYDATVNAFALMGISYVLGEILSDHKVSRKNCIIYISAFGIAAFVKMIYAPLILLGLLIPGEKFHTKKERNIFKFGIIFLTLALTATFVLPAGGSSAGDVRGGDTSVGRQMKAVFTHPIVYTKLLLSSIWNHLVDYSIGTSSMSLLGHAGISKYTQWITVFLACVTLTDKDEQEKTLNFVQKGFISILVFGIVCLVWTALYLSFTPVGSNAISGVQGRYFIPVLIPGLLLFRNKYFENKMNSVVYSKCVMGIAMCLTLFTYYGIFVRNCF